MMMMMMLAMMMMMMMQEGWGCGGSQYETESDIGLVLMEKLINTCKELQWVETNLINISWLVFLLFFN